MDEEFEELSEIEHYKRLNALFARMLISSIIEYGKIKGLDYKSVIMNICPESSMYSLQIEEFFNPDTKDHKVRITKTPESNVTH